MIGASELRLGNIVAFSDKIVRITATAETFLEGITRNGETFRCSADSATPILLTEKILERYGFQRYVHPVHGTITYYLTIIITPNIGNPDRISINFEPKQPPAGRLLGGSHTSSHEFYYLHQLQNLYHSVMRRELKPKQTPK